MKYLNEIHLWAERGKTFEEIVDGLPERSDDECYSAYHWLEDAAAKGGATGPMFPDIAFRSGPHTETKLVLSFIDFPTGTPIEAKELVALAVEHFSRQSQRASV